MSAGVPRAIALDLVPRRRPPGLLGWLVLAAGLGLAAAAVMQHDRLRERVDLAEGANARIERQLAAARSAAKAADPRPVPEQEAARALRIAGELGVDWAAVLTDLERAAGPEIGITSLQIRGDKASLAIGGEAHGLSELFDYVERLEAGGSLGTVRLSGFEIKRSGAAEVVVFNLTTGWERAK